jgi:hypothetical protein
MLMIRGELLSAGGGARRPRSSRSTAALAAAKTKRSYFQHLGAIVSSGISRDACHNRNGCPLPSTENVLEWARKPSFRPAFEAISPHTSAIPFAWYAFGPA